MLEYVKGNHTICRTLQKLLKSGNIPHALLFSGPSEAGKEQFARAFAAELLEDSAAAQTGQNPDLHEYYPEGKIGAHSIETLRSFCSDVSLAPYRANWKVFIVHDAERMLTYSANALLKTLEEPSPRTVIILISASPELLLPTIRSRCQIMAFEAECSQYPQEEFNYFDEFLLPVFSRGGFSGFDELTQITQAIAEKIDAFKNAADEYSSDAELTAMQRNQRQKSFAGAGAVQYSRSASALLEQIAAWYRDMMLLHFNGDPGILKHAKNKDALIQMIQQGGLREMDFVLAAVKEASQSLHRSTPLQNILESLFIRLQGFDIYRS